MVLYLKRAILADHEWVSLLSLWKAIVAAVMMAAAAVFRKRPRQTSDHVFAIGIDVGAAKNIH